MQKKINTAEDLVNDLVEHVVNLITEKFILHGTTYEQDQTDRINVSMFLSDKQKEQKYVNAMLVLRVMEKEAEELIAVKKELRETKRLRNHYRAQFEKLLLKS